MDFRLLGPFEVESDGRNLTPARPKQRLLLAALLLRAGEVVATDDLVETLWDGSPPPTAHKALQGHVAALRQLLGRDTIATRTPGYVLRADVGSIDARRFEALVETARAEPEPRVRSELLRSALALFQGEPLAEFRYERFARDEAARLEALRLGALADRIDADLALGRHAAVLPELDRLVAEHPHEERLRAMLMLALYRAGRQAQALEVYADGRRRLVEDLGIDPGPDLQQLERRILNQDPTLDGPATAAREGDRARLPRPATPLVGRDQELAEVAELLVGTRLLTLSGTAGTGKTRLAIAAAGAAADTYPGGAVFVGLAPIADPELVLPTIAQALAVTDTAAGSAEALATALSAAQPTLVVLDNCEHLLDAVPPLALLLEATPALHVLATSREPLRIGVERVYAVPPLRRDEAVSLFVERAQAVKPELEVGGAADDAIAAVCDRLDRLPLAIELAAARVVLFSPPALLARLDRRLPLLTAGRRDQPDRHRTLRAAIDWSYELLPEPERVLFAGLSVFAGGWTVDAAEAVCGRDVDVVERLASLVAKSLVQVTGGGDEPRFTMLETIREYARERLHAADEGEARRRHAEYILGLAEELEPVLVGHGGREAQRQLLAEVDNVRAALAWAIESGLGALALRLIWALWRFWWDHGLAAESHAWCEAALAAAPDAQPELRGRALFAASDMFYARGDWDEYRRVLREALTLLEAGSDEEFVLYTLWALSVADHAQGDQDAAGRRGLDALARAEAGGYDELIGRLNILLGGVALTRGDAGPARAHFETAAARHAEIGDLYGRAIALENLAIAAVLAGDPQAAATALAESFEGWDFSQNLHNLGHALVVAGGIAQSYGEPALAARLLGMVAAQFERVGVRLQPFEVRIDRETRELAKAELGAARYEEELRRGAAEEPPDVLPAVVQALRRWATKDGGARLNV